MTFICFSPFFDLAVRLVGKRGHFGGHLVLLETMHYTPSHTFNSKPEIHGRSELAVRREWREGKMIRRYPRFSSLRMRLGLLGPFFEECPMFTGQESSGLFGVA
jgi:hypothetical protein